ncbi:MAG: hypothetical protein JXR37_16710 [Kiritimatiellae bacterium]|nr:hypothetical protein [Kiritimatiellia bacterium]
MEEMIGVEIFNKCMLFSRTGDSCNRILSLQIQGGNSEIDCIVTALKPGTWKVRNGDTELRCQVSKDSRALFFRGKPGQYVLTPPS